MNRNLVGGIPLDAFKEPLPEALRAYGQNGGFRVDIDQALDIRQVEGKPNWGRSRTVIEIGDLAVEMFVIVMARGDGTGDESGRALDTIVDTGMYPSETKVVPRDKNVAGEVHLALATVDESGNATPFAGCLDLVGFKPNTNNSRLVTLGWLGQSPGIFWRVVRGEAAGSFGPTATYTVLRGANGDFGDPHAVYNPRLAQVCAFVTVPKGADPESLNALNARLPQGA